MSLKDINIRFRFNFYVTLFLVIFSVFTKKSNELLWTFITFLRWGRYIVRILYVFISDLGLSWFLRTVQNHFEKNIKYVLHIICSFYPSFLGLNFWRFLSFHVELPINSPLKSTLPCLIFDPPVIKDSIPMANYRTSTCKI